MRRSVVSLLKFCIVVVATIATTVVIFQLVRGPKINGVDNFRNAPARVSELRDISIKQHETDVAGWQINRAGYKIPAYY